jgi:hypothetical protein
MQSQSLSYSQIVQASLLLTTPKQPLKEPKVVNTIPSRSKATKKKSAAAVLPEELVETETEDQKLIAELMRDVGYRGAVAHEHDNFPQPMSYYGQKFVDEKSIDERFRKEYKLYLNGNDRQICAWALGQLKTVDGNRPHGFVFRPGSTYHNSIVEVFQRFRWKIAVRRDKTTGDYIPVPRDTYNGDHNNGNDNSNNNYTLEERPFTNCCFVLTFAIDYCGLCHDSCHLWQLYVWDPSLKMGFNVLSWTDFSSSGDDRFGDVYISGAFIPEKYDAADLTNTDVSIWIPLGHSYKCCTFGEFHFLWQQATLIPMFLSDVMSWQCGWCGIIEIGDKMPFGVPIQLSIDVYDAASQFGRQRSTAMWWSQMPLLKGFVEIPEKTKLIPYQTFVSTLEQEFDLGPDFRLKYIAPNKWSRTQATFQFEGERLVFASFTMDSSRVGQWSYYRGGRRIHPPSYGLAKWETSISLLTLLQQSFSELYSGVPNFHMTIDQIMQNEYGCQISVHTVPEISFLPCRGEDFRERLIHEMVYDISQKPYTIIYSSSLSSEAVAKREEIKQRLLELRVNTAGWKSPTTNDVAIQTSIRSVFSYGPYFRVYNIIYLWKHFRDIYDHHMEVNPMAWWSVEDDPHGRIMFIHVDYSVKEQWGDVLLVDRVSGSCEYLPSPPEMHLEKMTEFLL